jgi:hypothetical protein
MILETGDEVLYIGREGFTLVNHTEGTVTVCDGSPTIFTIGNSRRGLTYTIGKSYLAYPYFTTKDIVPIKNMSELEKLLYGVKDR